MRGRAYANVSSNRVGTSIITAGSPGLNPGAAYLTMTQVPIILEFRQWIYKEDEILSREFFTEQELNYSISLKGNGTSFSIPLLGVWWPNASITIDGALNGEVTIDSESLITKDYHEVRLPAGYHILNVTLRNDKYLPLIGDTNLYIDSVKLSG